MKDKIENKSKKINIIIIVVILICIAIVPLIYIIKFYDNQINDATVQENKEELISQNELHSKENDYKDEGEIIHYEPKIGMTKEEVMNTSWGKPQSIDHGGTFANNNNKKRTNGEWDEAWYYKRNDNTIFIYFKKGKVINFRVTFKGQLKSYELSSVEGL